MDAIEKEYEMAIRSAIEWEGDDLKAFELTQGLKEYRELYKVEEEA